MSKDNKKQLIDFNEAAQAIKEIQATLNEILANFKTQVSQPLIEESKKPETSPKETMKNTHKALQILIAITVVTHKLVKMVSVLDKQWEPEDEEPTVSDKEVILEFIRQMHKAGKLDFTY
jgi:hypothetical protein